MFTIYNAVLEGVSNGNLLKVSDTTEDIVPAIPGTDYETPLSFESGIERAGDTISLVDITPSSIVASGSISGANLSGTNTGDQTNVAGYSTYLTIAGSSNANTILSSTPAGGFTITEGISITNGLPGWRMYQSIRHTNGSNLWGVQVAWGWEDTPYQIHTRSASGGGFNAWQQVWSEKQSLLYGNGKEIFNTGDMYLRLNQTGAFTNGIWLGYSSIQTASHITAGSNGDIGTSRVWIAPGTYDGVNAIKIDGETGGISAKGTISVTAGSGVSTIAVLATDYVSTYEGLFLNYDNDTNVATLFAQNTTQLDLRTNGSTSITFTPYGTERMRIGYDGLVGITGNLLLGVASYSQTDTPRVLSLGGTYSDTDATYATTKLRLTDNGSEAFGIGVGSSNNIWFNGPSSSTIYQFFQNGTERVRIAAGVNIGGTADPGAGHLYVLSGDNYGDYLTPNIAKFYANNLTQGVGIGYNGLSAIGTATDQSLFLKAKGAGTINLQNSVNITGRINAADHIIGVSANYAPNVVFEGDSLTQEIYIEDGSDVSYLPYNHYMGATAGSGNSNFIVPAIGTYVYGGIAIDPLKGQNVGVAAATVTSLYESSYRLNNVFRRNAFNVAVVLAGTNDLGAGRSAPQVYASIEAYCRHLKNLGWRVILVGLIARGPSTVSGGTPFGGGTSYDALIGSVNGLIRQNHTQFTDRFIDWGVINGGVNEFAVGADSDPVYYNSDRLHKTAAGGRKFASYVQPVIDDLLYFYFHTRTNQLFVHVNKTAHNTTYAQGMLTLSNENPTVGISDINFAFNGVVKGSLWMEADGKSTKFDQPIQALSSAHAPTTGIGAAMYYDSIYDYAHLTAYRWDSAQAWKPWIIEGSSIKLAATGVDALLIQSALVQSQVFTRILSQATVTAPVTGKGLEMYFDGGTDYAHIHSIDRAGPWKGMYFGASQFNFATGGTIRMILAPSGGVNIGSPNDVAAGNLIVGPPVSAGALPTSRLLLLTDAGAVTQRMLSLREGGNAGYGWDWMVDDATTGDMSLQRVLAGTGIQILNIARASGDFSFSPGGATTMQVTTKALKISGGAGNSGGEGAGIHLWYTGSQGIISSSDPGIVGKPLQIFGYPLQWGSSNTGGIIATVAETGFNTDIPMRVLRNAVATPTSGAGLELQFKDVLGTDFGFIRSVDWGAAAWRNLNFEALQFRFDTNGTLNTTISSTGIATVGNLYLGKQDQRGVIFRDNSGADKFMVGRSYANTDAHDWFLHDVTANQSRIFVGSNGGVSFGGENNVSRGDIMLQGHNDKGGRIYFGDDNTRDLSYFYQVGVGEYYSFSAGPTVLADGYTVRSSGALKQNITSWTKKDVVDSFYPKIFQYTASPTINRVGLVAEELRLVLPEAVKDGPEGPAIDPWVVTMALIEEVKLLKKDIKELKLKK